MTPWNGSTHTCYVESEQTLARRVGDFSPSGFEKNDESHASASTPPELPPPLSDSDSDEY